jgi:chromatin structure-remodeling complex subunit RSC9
LRCLQSLLSRIPAEQAFALNHLVKISFERGDKFRFEQFPKLVEGLVEKALEVGNLFYQVEWTITYDSEQEDGPIEELDGNTGTADIIERIAQLVPKPVMDGIMPAEFSDRLTMITEAVLTIRNMVMLQDNAAHISDYPMLSDMLCIILHLPKLEMAVELKHFALDIAEQVTPYMTLESEDPLYQTLLAQLLSNPDDRGTVLTALRAVGRISMNLAEANKLGNVPEEVLEKIKNWLLINDDELMDACLDFLYQYTAVAPNLETLIKASALDDLVTHLVRLLSHGAKREQREHIIEPERRIGGLDDPCPPPLDLLEQLLALEEPQRCHAWVRSFFEADPDGQVTQISIWQGYNNAFLEPLKKAGRPMIQAAEFIRSISTVYENAAARIKSEGPNGEVKKFIIEGIRPRMRPVGLDGSEYFPCLWARKNRQPNENAKCLTWLPGATQMWQHIITHHLEEAMDPQTYLIKDHVGTYTCYWAACGKYNAPTETSLFVFASHVKLHANQAFAKLDDKAGSDLAQTPGSTGAKRQPRAYVVPAKAITIKHEETLAVLADQRNPNSTVTAGGIPLSAVLVLRNIARNIVKTDAQDELLQHGNEEGGWNERLFRSHRGRLYEIMTENKLLGPHVASLLQTISEQ